MMDDVILYALIRKKISTDSVIKNHFKTSVVFLCSKEINKA